MKFVWLCLCLFLSSFAWPQQEQKPQSILTRLQKLEELARQQQQKIAALTESNKALLDRSRQLENKVGNLQQTVRNLQDIVNRASTRSEQAVNLAQQANSRPFLTTPDGKYQVHIQGDANLVIYRVHPWQAVWDSRTVWAAIGRQNP